MLALVLASVVPRAVLANPTGGTVTAGNANISSAGTTLTVNQSSDKAVIDWRGFDIAAGETTNFVQPSSSSVTLNRVNSASASIIDGALNANGNIVIINQNGVLFGKNSVVNVNSMLATTADIDTAQFMAGSMKFDKPGNPNATIENRGLITAQQAGLVGLVAPNVLNSGIIEAKLGRVQLASGDAVTVDFYGDGLLEVQASPALQKQLVKNTGTLRAEGGTVAMTAAAAAQTVNSLIDAGGTLDATAVGTKNGHIYIYAEGTNAVADNVAANKGQKSGGSTVTVSGKLDASSASGKGGAVNVLGDNVTLTKTASIDARGATGGGTIQVGGAIHGAGTTPTALTTTLEDGAFIDASATLDGNGGAVTLWSEAATTFSGSILANGAGSGNGGFVETSSHGTLLAFGHVGAASANGSAGEWLLDPADITITNSTTTNNTTTSPYAATGTGSQVSAANIKSDLDAGTNVTVSTSNDIYAGSGDITVSGAITTTGTGSLTLSAYRDINVAAGITLDGGGLTLRSANSGNNIGAVNIAAAINTNGGNITIGGGNGASITAGSGYAVGDAQYASGVTVTSTMSAGAGKIIINGQGFNTSTAGNDGVNINGGAISTGSGDITITGIAKGTGSSASDYGVAVQNGGSIITDSGALSVTGTGAGATSAAEVGVYVKDASSTIESTGIGSVTVIGSSTNSGGGSNSGVKVASTNGIQATGSGDISVTGTGGSTGASNVGISVSSGSIANSGSGKVTLNGSTTSTGGSNTGILIANGTVSTTSGDLTVAHATGGTTSGSNNTGLSLTGSGQMKAGAGNIVVTSASGGGGGSAAGSDVGIIVGDGSASTAALITTGAGSITIVSSTSSDSTGKHGTDYGLEVNSTFGIEAQGGGSVTVHGSGGGTGTADHNYGVYVKLGTISAAGNGGVAIFGTGGRGTGGSNNGIVSAVANGIETTGIGTLTLKGTAQTASSYGIVASTANAFTTTSTGDIAVYSDTYSLGAANAIKSGGNLTLASYTNIITGIGDSAGGANNLSDALLGDLSAASYTFGALVNGDGTANTSAMFVNTGVDFGNSNLTFVTGGNLSLGGTLTKNSGTGTATYIFDANGSISNSSSAGVSANAGKANVIFDPGFNGSSGTTTLTGATLATNGGDVTFDHSLALGGDLAVTAGTGSVTFGGTVNGGYNLTASASGFVFNGAWGGSAPLAAVSLTSANTLALPSINATSIFARTTNASADILLASGHTLAASGSGTAVTLAAGRNFINQAGSNAVTLSGGGRWLIYSASPSADTLGSLNSGNTAIWNTAYGASITPSGNRYIFTWQPTATFASGNLAKTYGTDDSSALASDYTVSGVQTGVTGAFLGDNPAAVFSGAPDITSVGANAAASLDGSPYVLNLAQGSLTSTSGYLFAYSSTGRLTIIPGASQIPSTVQVNSQGPAVAAAAPVILDAPSIVFTYGSDALGMPRAHGFDFDISPALREKLGYL
ncbi:MAG: filamentous hemagglutinin N-terminal domain-containing protein [Alphaproteobacteria bacterium]|nr:filamentous hemagglutinin N-terminal domain-containing protein [Alphaproteobacteria bacterium]